MLVFIVPVKSRQASSSWALVSKLFERTLKSICQQTSSKFQVIVVCHDKPQISFSHPQVVYHQVDFTSPTLESDPETKMLDKRKKVVTGLVLAKQYNPTHVMPVDADDCINAKIAEYVGDRPDEIGWFVDRGYEYLEGKDRLIPRNSRFNDICGSCNILRYDLCTLPESLEVPKLERYYINHFALEQLLERNGTPLQPLPFHGAVYVQSQGPEQWTKQVNSAWLDLLKHDWKQFVRKELKMILLRPLKLSVMQMLQSVPLTQQLQGEFGLYPLTTQSAPEFSGVIPVAAVGRN